MDQWIAAGLKVLGCLFSEYSRSASLFFHIVLLRIITRSGTDVSSNTSCIKRLIFSLIQ
jgi:hypothetical protein